MRWLFLSWKIKIRLNFNLIKKILSRLLALLLYFSSENAIIVWKKVKEFTVNKKVVLISIDGMRPDGVKKDFGNVNVIDIAPTIAKIMGFAPEEDWEGKSLI